MLYECTHSHECSNQNFTRFKLTDVHLYGFKTTNGRGYGVKTNCDLLRDQAIIEVTGKVVFEWKVSFYLLNQRIVNGCRTIIL